MRKKTPSNPNHGFTLIEIMVVIFIFMIAMLTVTMNTNFDYTNEKRVQGFTENLLAKIKMAKQTAVYQHIAMRFVVQGRYYGFQKYQTFVNGAEWVWIENDDLLKKREFDKDIAMQLESAFVFYPNGRFTPFILTVINKKNNVHFRIVGNTNGEMELAGQ